MVKLKRKYVLAEVLCGDRNYRINDTSIYNAALTQVGHLHGDYGVGCLLTSFQVKICDDATNIVVFRLSADACHILTSSLPFVTCIGSSACTFRLIFEASSLRSVERHLIRKNLADLYARLRATTKPAEKAHLQQAICSVTGSRMSKTRM